MGMRYGYGRYPRKVFTGAVMRATGAEKDPNHVGKFFMFMIGLMVFGCFIISMIGGGH